MKTTKTHRLPNYAVEDYFGPDEWFEDFSTMHCFDGDSLETIKGKLVKILDSVERLNVLLDGQQTNVRPTWYFDYESIYFDGLLYDVELTAGELAKKAAAAEKRKATLKAKLIKG